jgi:hypothetical protein
MRHANDGHQAAYPLVLGPGVGVEVEGGNVVTGLGVLDLEEAHVLVPDLANNSTEAS